MDKILQDLIDSAEDNTLDLSEIPLSELKKQYVEYAITQNPTTYHDKLIRTSLIKESKISVTHSEPLIDVQKEISKKYNLEHWQFRMKELFNKISVAVIIPHIGSNIDMLIEDMYTLGYHYSIAEPIKKYTLFNMQYIAITFEPLFTTNIANKIRKMKRLMHLTPQSNEISICANGFIPNHQNKKYNYPDRVYFITEDATDRQILDLYYMLSDISGDRNYSLFTINPQKLDMNIRFYADPMYQFDVFTYDNISKDTIIQLQKLVPAD